jgi:hypothetical protein
LKRVAIELRVTRVQVDQRTAVAADIGALVADAGIPANNMAPTAALSNKHDISAG